MDALTLINLTAPEFAALALIVTIAGVVRGFSGFALSALVMASGVLILPPIELIPICWCLEMAASVLMARGGWQEADRRIVMGLVIGSTLGVPFGVLAVQALSVEASKAVVLTVIIILALTQLARIRIAFLATKAGVYAAGFVAGIVTGLASVGGMVVALYVLSQDAPAAKMRAALVLFLFISLFTTIITYLATGVMNAQAATRGLALSAFACAGVFAGQKLFIPRFAPFYRPFCLLLLSGLAVSGLVRTQLS
ncbi:sulfite exporter TauE/SafE family protein [Yoonia sediminilitoris]|uniref:Probable membrane transporter protein n=1 Tax=Yoonia sediminilitoris TaxID=1286148 RepID=A0A2T6K7K5_9RHOB|nr:sulfite exporter TauE/SafE family protein [Yoonia sediminilitoris]PUB10702.1 hypothetical protein C8N45_11747 [Yoonia sediminilitoris]RCW90454.1 hypothetical protein DFP92_11747 [Yoonia sediminilitoris]